MTSFAGLHVACIVNEFSQIQNTFLTSQSHALNEFFIAVLLPRLLAGSPPTVEKPATQNHAPNTYCWCGGEDEGKMVIMHRVKENGSTFSVLVLLASQEENGFVLTIVERWICYEMHCNMLIYTILNCYHGTTI